MWLPSHLWVSRRLLTPILEPPMAIFFAWAVTFWRVNVALNPEIVYMCKSGKNPPPQPRAPAHVSLCLVAPDPYGNWITAFKGAPDSFGITGLAWQSEGGLSVPSCNSNHGERGETGSRSHTLNGRTRGNCFEKVILLFTTLPPTLKNLKNTQVQRFGLRAGWIFRPLGNRNLFAPQTFSRDSAKFLQIQHWKLFFKKSSPHCLVWLVLMRIGGNG